MVNHRVHSDSHPTAANGPYDHHSQIQFDVHVNVDQKNTCNPNLACVLDTIKELKSLCLIGKI